MSHFPTTAKLVKSAIFKSFIPLTQDNRPKMAPFTSHQKVMATLNKILQHQLLLLNSIKLTNDNTTIVFAPVPGGGSAPRLKTLPFNVLVLVKMAPLLLPPPSSYTPRISQNNRISFVCRLFPQRLQAFLGFALLFLPEFGFSGHLFHLAAQFGDPSNTLKITIFPYP